MTSTNQSNIVCLVEDVSCFQLAVCRILSCLAFGINIRQEEGQFLQILILCVLCAVQKLCILNTSTLSCNVVAAVYISVASTLPDKSVSPFTPM